MNEVIHNGKRMVPAFGIPYAEQVRVLGQWSAICPSCKRAIPLRKRKDYESYSGEEYSKHYHEEHAAADGRVTIDGIEYEPE